jgi:hypothetical protein
MLNRRGTFCAADAPVRILLPIYLHVGFRTVHAGTHSIVRFIQSSRILRPSNIKRGEKQAWKPGLAPFCKSTLSPKILVLLRKLG